MIPLKVVTTRERKGSGYNQCRGLSMSLKFTSGGSFDVPITYNSLFSGSDGSIGFRFNLDSISTVTVFTGNDTNNDSAILWDRDNVDWVFRAGDSSYTADGVSFGAGEDHSLICTKKGAVGNVIFDGIELPASAGSLGANWASQNIRVGKFHNGTSPVDGLLNELFFTDHVITEDEAFAWHHHNTKGDLPSGVVEYFPLLGPDGVSATGDNIPGVFGNDGLASGNITYRSDDASLFRNDEIPQVFVLAVLLIFLHKLEPGIREGLQLGLK